MTNHPIAALTLAIEGADQRRQKAVEVSVKAGKKRQEAILADDQASRERGAIEEEIASLCRALRELVSPGYANQDVREVCELAGEPLGDAP